MDLKKSEKHLDYWAAHEFGKINLGDKRLNCRLILVAGFLSKSTQSPINKACSEWPDTKGTYRFFQNENVCEREALWRGWKRLSDMSDGWILAWT